MKIEASVWMVESFLPLLSAAEVHSDFAVPENSVDIEVHSVDTPMVQSFPFESEVDLQIEASVKHLD